MLRTLSGDQGQTKRYFAGGKESSAVHCRLLRLLSPVTAGKVTISHARPTLPESSILYICSNSINDLSSLFLIGSVLRCERVVLFYVSVGLINILSGNS